MDYFAIFFCLLIFLFCLYSLSHEDFLLMRKNISTENVFNFAFIIILGSFLFARICYVVFNFKPSFLNPLVFFLFPYFPGFSLSGGVLGGIIFIFFFSEFKKMPTSRILDFFALSFFSALPAGLFIKILNDLFSKRLNSVFEPVILLIFLIIFIILLKMFQKGRLQEGTIGFLILIIYPIFYSLINFFENKEKFTYFLLSEGLILIGFFLAGIFFVIKQEKIILKFRKLIKI